MTMKPSICFAACAAMGALSAVAQNTSPPPTPPPPGPPLPVSLPVLIDAAQAALAACRASGWPVSLTVLDADGTMRLQLRDEGSGANTVEISYRKAYTVIKTGMSSDDFFKSLKPEDIVIPPRPPGATGPGGGEPTVRNGDPKLLPRAGGLPIMLKGKMVGAMGVSGRPRGADVDCAQAGLEKIDAATR